MGAAVAFAIGALCARAAPVYADAQVDRLAAIIANSSSDKERVAAVVGLANIGGKATLKPLVAALSDPNPKVRATAAGALGHLGHPAALPSLRELSTNDSDASVRSHAHTAAVAIARANHLPDEAAAAPAVAAAAQPSAAAAADDGSHSRYGGFGHSPHAVGNHPDLYITVKTSNDDSPGRLDKESRRVHGELLKATLLDGCKSQPQVTVAADEAKRWGLDPRQIDVSVVKLDATPSGGYMEVEAQLRLAISDNKGVMQSFLSGGAKVQVPLHSFNPSALPALRKEALENAMRGMLDKLLAHLRRTAA